MTELTHGSLFSGYEGLGMAVEAALGARTAWVSDVDPGANTVLAHRLPGVRNLGDIVRIPWADVPTVDILSGGTPCQDLSMAGRRAGMSEGTRSNLWAQMREGINTLRPALVVWENVRGALSARADGDLGWTEGLLDERPAAQVPAQEKDHALRALGRVLGDLADLGFDAEWVTLGAADVGAPHKRERVFLLAWPREFTSPADSLRSRGWRGSPQPEQAGGDHALVGPGARGDGGGRDPLNLLPTPRTSDTNGAGKHGDGGMDLRTAATLTDFGRYAPAIKRWEAITGQSAPAPTKPSPRNGKPQLSADFVEWMMGLPQGWVCDSALGLTRRQQLQLLGNGVVPRQAAAAITHMMRRAE